jgi:hypothetical protein
VDWRCCEETGKSAAANCRAGEIVLISYVKGNSSGHCTVIVLVQFLYLYGFCTCTVIVLVEFL